MAANDHTRNSTSTAAATLAAQARATPASSSRQQRLFSSGSLSRYSRTLKYGNGKQAPAGFPKSRQIDNRSTILANLE